MQNIVRSRNGTYHRCLGIAGEHGRANCNQGLLTRLATADEARRALIHHLTPSFAARS